MKTLAQALGLTQQEEEIIILRLEGKTYPQIAKQVGGSEGKIYYNMSNLTKKITCKMELINKGEKASIECLGNQRLAVPLRRMGINTISDLIKTEDTTILESKTYLFGKKLKQQAISLKHELEKMYETL